MYELILISIKPVMVIEAFLEQFHVVDQPRKYNSTMICRK